MRAVQHHHNYTVLLWGGFPPSYCLHNHDDCVSNQFFQHRLAAFMQPLFTAVIAVIGGSDYSSKQRLHEWKPMFTTTTVIAVIGHSNHMVRGPVSHHCRGYWGLKLSSWITSRI